MSKKLTDGLARLQNQSRVPVSKWREWCTLLRLDPIHAVETWEEICYPIMVATRSMPVQEIAYILQMRTARPELDVLEFKEEAPKILHAITFLYNLNDERLTKKGIIRSTILKYYKRRSSDMPVDQRPTVFVQRFIVELCSLVLIAKVLKGQNITLTGPLKLLIAGHGTLVQLLGLASMSLGGQVFDESVRACLQLVNPDPSAPPAKITGNGHGAAVNDGVDDDDEGAGDDEDLSGEDEDPVAIYLGKFKRALQVIYEVEADSGGAPANSEAIRDSRFRTIAAFNPMNAVVPALEEAQAIARRLEAARNPHKPIKNSISLSSGGRGGAIPSGPMSAAGATAIAKEAQICASRRRTVKAANVVASTALKCGEAAGEVGSGEVEVESRDVVQPTPVSQSEFGSKVREIGAALASIAPADQVCWNVFMEPGTRIDSLWTFARAVSREGSGQFVAYNALKSIAMLLPVKGMLTVADKGGMGNRNLNVEVITCINTIMNYDARELAPDSRQLKPLAKILDHASAALLRLEAIRINQAFSEDHPDEYAKQAVVSYYEECLRVITGLTDREVLGAARSQADTDTVAMLEIFAARKFADAVVEVSKEYAEKLREAGHTKSKEAAAAAMSQDPLALEDAEPNPNAGQVPPDLLVSSGLGDTFDAIAQYVVTQAWAVLHEVHEPPTVAARVLEALRQVLVSTFQLQPEKKRHQENPTMALNVVTLDKISGKQSFMNLCVRVGDNGKVLYIHGFEDGSYVDLFELREYKPSRMRAKEKTAEDEVDLQTGRKYLYTVGRTNCLFGESPSHVINSCIRGVDGTPKVFPVL